MASSPRELMTLGMFIFGMESAAYQELQREREWRFETSERHGARDVAQFIGPGSERISLGGLIVPEIGGRYSSIETLAEMADTGDAYPLIDGTGQILGHYRITRIDETHQTIMAGGIPRQIGFRIELERDADNGAQTAQGAPA